MNPLLIKIFRKRAAAQLITASELAQGREIEAAALELRAHLLDWKGAAFRDVIDFAADKYLNEPSAANIQAMKEACILKFVNEGGGLGRIREVIKNANQSYLANNLVPYARTLIARAINIVAAEEAEVRAIEEERMMEVIGRVAGESPVVAAISAVRLELEKMSGTIDDTLAMPLPSYWVSILGYDLTSDAPTWSAQGESLQDSESAPL